MEGKTGNLNLKKRFNVRTYTMVLAMLVLWVVFTITTDGSFISPRNLSNLMRQTSIVGIMGTAMVLVIVSGGIDLSVGSVMGFLSCMAAALQVWGHWGTAETIVVTLASGAAIGFLQGVLVARTGVPPFIITLGGMMFFRGGILAVTRGTTVAPLEQSFLDFGQAYILPSVGMVLAVAVVLLFIVRDVLNLRAKKQIGADTDSTAWMILRWIGISVLIIGSIIVMNLYKGLPEPVLLMLVLVVIFTFIAEKTTFGRRIYAIGGNIEAAIYAGINVRNNISIVYMLNGAMAAVAGIVLAARLNAGTPTAGQNYELDAIAAAVIGGTSMSGGAGRVPGAILGAMVMATIDNGMSMMNMESFWQYMVKGVILVVAVWFDVRTRTKGKN
jgi:D-xylose transport system permease protein